MLEETDGGGCSECVGGDDVSCGTGGSDSGAYVLEEETDGDGSSECVGGDGVSCGSGGSECGGYGVGGSDRWWLY